MVIELYYQREATMIKPTKRQEALLDELLQGVKSSNADAIQPKEGLMNKISKQMVEACSTER